MTTTHWVAPEGYERFMGRWSRLVAERFVPELGVPAGRRWLDVGCGTGVLARTILDLAAPSAVVGVDTSAAFLEYAAAAAPIQVHQADAEALPLDSDTVDATVSALALNHVTDPAAALAEMIRVTRPGGTVGAYVWDYDFPDFFLTRFWQGAAAAAGSRVPGDERGRWPVCSPNGARALVERSALRAARAWTIEVDTVFATADDLWDGFLLGVGPSGAWATGLDPDGWARLRARLDALAPAAADGTVPLRGRAVALCGTAP